MGASFQPQGWPRRPSWGPGGWRSLPQGGLPPLGRLRGTYFLPGSESLRQFQSIPSPESTQSRRGKFNFLMQEGGGRDRGWTGSQRKGQRRAEPDRGGNRARAQVREGERRSPHWSLEGAASEDFRGPSGLGHAATRRSWASGPWSRALVSAAPCWRLLVSHPRTRSALPSAPRAAPAHPSPLQTSGSVTLSAC